MNASKVAGLCLIGISVNAISVAKEHDMARAMSTVFAGVGLFAGLTAIGEYIDWSLAIVLAMLFVLASFLTRGQGAIAWTSKLVEGL